MPLRSSEASYRITSPMSWSDKKLSKFMSLILRHRPDEIGLRMEPGGWARVDELVQKARNSAAAPLSRKRIERLVEEQPKPRFALSPDRRRIRANYGHSLDVDLRLEPELPPDRLYHGTAARALEAILQDGLESRSRQYVHLSENAEDARRVGVRHGSPRILLVRARRMAVEDHPFYRPAGGIWLTRRVPPEYLDFADG